MVYYNKLVRDKIPELLEQAGKKGTFRILGNREFESELKKKLAEGVKEYRETGNEVNAAEELAELFEILIALTKVHDLTLRELDEIRQEKARRHGRFHERLFLIKVED